MERKGVFYIWFMAMCVGSSLALVGAGMPGPLILCGLGLNTLASAISLLLIRPHRTPFMAESLTTSLFVMPCLSIAVSAPRFGIVIAVLWVVVYLPTLVLGVFAADHFRANLRSRIPLHVAVLLPYCLAVWAQAPSSRYSLAEPEPVFFHDRLDDKTPVFVESPEFWRALNAPSGAGKPVEINKSAAVVSLNRMTPEPNEADLESARFATYREAVAFLKARDQAWMPSFQMVDHKVKVFADSAYAALDQFTQREADRLGGGRQVFLEGLLQALLADKAADGAAYLAAALQLSGLEPEMPADIAERAQEFREEFLQDDFASKPVGFYTESEALRRVFQQNRFCQRDLEKCFGRERARRIGVEIACALEASASLTASYDAILALQSRTTNPPDDGFIGLKGFTPERMDGSKHVALFPPSGAKENQLFAFLYQTPELPNENIMNRLITAIRDGQVDLAPDEHSGWYDYQIYALETLLLPERGAEEDKLILYRGYKEHLAEAFRTVLTKQRETHVGHLGIPAAESAVPMALDVGLVTPDLSVEPTATAYLRTARALRFLEGAVTAILGEADYSTIKLEDGAPLGGALRDTAQLLYGLYFQVCDDLGMKPKLKEEELTEEQVAAARERAKMWLNTVTEDPVYSSDVRYIVPALTDAAHRDVRYWMTTGIRLRKVKAIYERLPNFRIDGQVVGDEYYRHGISIAPREFYLPVEEFAEATGSKVPLTREEFRALCDRAGSREAIVRAVEGRPTILRLLILAAVSLVAGAVVAVSMWRRFRPGRT